jgi:hypothetical protein
MLERAATAAQIKRVIEAVKKSGLTIARVEVEGPKVIVCTSTETDRPKTSALDKWLEKKNRNQGK